MWCARQVTPGILKRDFGEGEVLRGESERQSDGWCSARLDRCYAISLGLEIVFPRSSMLHMPFTPCRRVFLPTDNPPNQHHRLITLAWPARICFLPSLRLCRKGYLVLRGSVELMHAAASLHPVRSSYSPITDQFPSLQPPLGQVLTRRTRSFADLVLCYRGRPRAFELPW